MDFPEEYLYRPCLCIDDAEYRQDIMDEIFLSQELYSNLSEFIISLRSFNNKMEEYRKTKEFKQKQYR